MDKRKQRVTKWLTWLVITAQLVALFSTATVTVIQPTPALVQEVGQQANLANTSWQWVVDTAAQGAGLVQAVFGAPKVALAETGSFQVSASGSNFSCAINSSNGVQCWGNNASGQLGNGTNTQSLVPVQVTGLTGGVIDIAAGSLFACALTSSGGVKCWGENGGGQLGNKDATLADSNTPVDVYSLATGVVALDGGDTHMCALLATGGVKCWGGNASGQIGDGAKGNNLWPVHALGLQSGVASISAGADHTCAVLTDGTAKCWGADGGGALGNTGGNSLTPVPVVVDSAGVAVSGIMAISAGSAHTCALLTTGGLKCWGTNTYGQLGNSNATNQNYPVNVTGLTSGVAAVSAGDSYTCAVLADGSAKCWGQNYVGQLGNGTTSVYNVPNSTPLSVSGLSSGVASISTEINAGIYSAHTCAAMAAGGVKCWGNNSNGQLGNNSTTNSSSQVNVTSFTGLSVTAPIVKFVPVGGFNFGPQNLNVTSAVRTATLYNASGAAASITAISITGTDAGEFAISGGTCGSTFPIALAAGNTCTMQVTFTPTTLGGKTAKIAVTSNAPAVSIPLAGVGATVGTGAPTITSNGGLATANVSVFENGVYVTAVTAQGASPITFSLFGGADQGRFAIDATGNLRFNTAPDFEAPVDSNTDNVYEVSVLVQNGEDAVTQDIAVKVQDAPDTFNSVIGSGAGFSCAVVSGGAVKCWGKNTSGQIGDGTTTQRNLPTAVSGLSGIKAVAVGTAFACALTNGGGVQCWGENGNGQLGDGTTTDSNVPLQVQGLTSGVVALDAGDIHMCVLTSGGAMKCWGGNASGQLGSGGSGNVTNPSDVSGLTSGVAAISAGADHSCAVLTNSTAKCWGSDSGGALGAVGGNSTTPVPVVADGNGVVVTGFRTISAGGGHTCAATTTGAVKCWGTNTYGQLGLGNATAQSYPAEVPTLLGAVDPGGVGVAALSAGDNYTCAALNDGTARCWGQNYVGQLGYGAVSAYNVPNSTPLPVTGLSSGVVAISAQVQGSTYTTHTCAATNDGAIKCWGDGATGGLGYGAINDKLYPVMAGDASNPASAPTTPVASFSPTSGSTIAFGSQAVGSPSSPQTVTINNSGASPLTLNSASVTGSNYAISGGTCGTTFPVIVNAGANCTLQITFTPVSAGSKISTLSVSSDSGGQTTTNTISLTGTGVTGPTATPTPNLTATADALATANAAATATAAANATATAIAQATVDAAATATAIAQATTNAAATATAAANATATAVAQATANAAATATAAAGGPTATPTTNANATATAIAQATANAAATATAAAGGPTATATTASSGPDLTVTIGQPSPSFVAGSASNLPVTVANVGSGPTTGSISASVTLPTGTGAPASFTSGVWSCTTSGQTVTCTQAGPIAAGGSSVIQLPVTPSAGVVGTTPGPFNGTATTPGETNTGNNGATPMTPTTPVAPASANSGSIKVILGGAYDPATGFMRDNLRSLAAFPSTSPYGDGATISNRSVLTANNIVDWVLVELHDATTPATVSASKGALLQRDGDVVGTDGVSNLTFTGLSASSYYVAIKHRNHLGTMTNGAVSVNAGMVTVDFTMMVTTYGTNGQRYYNNKYMLWPGDATADRKVIMAGPNNDTNGILSTVLGDSNNTAGNANYIVRGYSVGDVNLDGKVLASGPNNDRSVIASTVFVYPLNSSGSANYIINQQMP